MRTTIPWNNLLRDEVESPVTVGFQDVIGQGARESQWSSLSHERLDQMIFQGPFQLGLFYDSVLFILLFWRNELTESV